MRKVIILLSLLLSLIGFGQNSAVSGVAFEIGKENIYKANLNEGVFLKDLSWAWSSQNACFTEIQKTKFTGKHVFFTGIIPAHSITSIEVIPLDKKANFSIYGYQINLNEDFLVPNLPHCIACEADFKWDYQKKNSHQNHIRKIGDFTAIDSSYRLVIGVTAANGLDNGDFYIKIKTKAYR